MLIGLIGLGGIARRVYLPLLSGWEGIELILCSRREESVRQAQARYRIPEGTTDLNELIRRQPRAAIVLTPAETHGEIASRLLDAGIDVYLEKPATESAAQTRQLAELADRYQRILMVGFNRRFAPMHVRARELLGSTPISLGLFSKYRNSPSSPDLYHQMLDDTIHQIDTLRFFCGEARAVATHWLRREGKVSAAVFTVALERGGLAQVQTSLEGGAWEEQYDLFGGGQSVHVDAFERVSLTNRDGKSEWKEGYASTYISTLEGRGFSGEVQHFFDCVVKRQQPQTSAWDSAKTQSLLEDMLEKAEELNE